MRRAAAPPCGAALLAALLVAAAVVTTGQPAAAADARPAYLSPEALDASKWHYSSQLISSRERFWDYWQLQSALAVRNLDQMRPFAARLLSGQPVTVLALGSSIVQDNAGIFHSSLEAVTRAVPVPNLWLYQNHLSLPSDGWAQMFMEYVNATWPHRDHLFINGGAWLLPPPAAPHSLQPPRRIRCRRCRIVGSPPSHPPLLRTPDHAPIKTICRRPHSQAAPASAPAASRAACASSPPSPSARTSSSSRRWPSTTRRAWSCCCCGC
jgi:hypothetical protein